MFATSDAFGSRGASGPGCARCDITGLSPHGPAGDTRAATRGRRARPATSRGTAGPGRRDGHPAGCSITRGAGTGIHPRGTLARRRHTGRLRDGTSDGAERPHPRGWRHIEHGLRQQLGWAPGCPCPAGSASRKEGGGIPWAAPGCLCPGGGRRRGQRDTLCPPFPALRATLSRRLRAIKGHTEGFSAASAAGAEPRGSRSPQLPQPGASPRAGREAEAGTPIPGCGSFGRRPNARAVSDSRCAAPRAAMLRTAAGAGSGDTEVRTP